MYKKYFKRTLDFIFSFFGILILSPLLLTITFLIIVIDMHFPFFIQARPGKDGKIFKIIKFKTMSDNVDSNGFLLPDEQRLTKIGRFIRKFSLDELLQLINILQGDMSLIGPRPLLVRYLPLYNEFQKKRHLVKPGITGWAQVNGRNLLSWNDKFKYDVYYVENVSLLLDLKIMIKTVLKIFNSEGINSQNSSTMEKFKGNL